MGQGIPGIFQRRVSFIISSFDSLTLALPSVAFCCCAAQDRPAEKRKKRLFLLLFYKKKYVFIFAAAISDGRKKERIARLSFPCGTMSGRFIRATHAHSTVQVYILRLDLIIPPITSSLFLGT